jgi:hypothetical protein
MVNVWILVFVFNGAIQTAALMDLEHCTYRASVMPTSYLATCIHMDIPLLQVRVKSK